MTDSQSTEVDNLHRLLASIESGRPIPDDVAEWLHDGVATFLNGKVSTLCGALCIRKSGKKSLQYQQAKEKRDAAIRFAYSTTNSSNPGEFCELMHRFEQRTWKRVRCEPQEKLRLTPEQNAIYEVFELAELLDLRVPKSRRTLERILQKSVATN
ncbi:MAG: hypothetical protein ABW072_16100 [Sedimenticola sp.]